MRIVPSEPMATVPILAGHRHLGGIAMAVPSRNGREFINLDMLASDYIALYGSDVTIVHNYLYVPALSHLGCDFPRVSVPWAPDVEAVTAITGPCFYEDVAEAAYPGGDLRDWFCDGAPDNKSHLLLEGGGRDIHKVSSRRQRR